MLTQLVECQPHEMKVVSSIPTRGMSRFELIFFLYDLIQPRLVVVDSHVYK